MHRPRLPNGRGVCLGVLIQAMKTNLTLTPEMHRLAKVGRAKANDGIIPYAEWAEFRRLCAIQHELTNVTTPAAVTMVNHRQETA
jgi:hypothetical protein